jgi:hypothetical protein
MLRHRINVATTATEVEGKVHVGTPKSWEKRSVPFPEFLSVPSRASAKARGRTTWCSPTPSPGAS